MRRKTLEQCIAQRVARSNREVFLREDFRDMGGYDQVGRALRNLTAQDSLIKIGYGLYAKAQPAPLSGKPAPRRGIRDLATEALGRLNIPTAPSSYERDYINGKTTQVPTGRVIAVGGRTTRKIGYSGKYVTFERGA